MKNVFTIVLFFLFSICGNAQYTFEYLTTKDGLSSNRIGSILRDSKGYLWIGSEIGLDKYDGYKIKTYRHNEKQCGTLSSNNTWDILEDHNKNVWISTLDGLNLYIPEGDSFMVFRNNPTDIHSIDNNRIHTLFEDSKGNLWVSTRGICLNKWVPATKQFIRYPIKNNSGYHFLGEDSKGNLWVVSEGLHGIRRFDPKTGNLTTYLDTTCNLGIKSKKLYIDKDDKIWITPYGEGLFSFDPSTGKFEQFSSKGDGKGTNGKLIISIIEEDPLHLWIGVDQGGINRFNKGSRTFEYIMYKDADEDGLNNDGIWKLYKDKEGIIWVGTSGGGINIYNPKKRKFKLFRHNINNPNSVSSNIIGCFYEDSQGMIWIGTDNNGLNVFNPKTSTFKSFKLDPANPFSISSNTIRCIREDENKDLWIGTWNKGFNRFDRKTGKFSCYMPDAAKPNSLSGPTVWHYTIDHKGIFWLAIHDIGVDVFDIKRGVIKRFIPDSDNPKALSDAKVWYIHEDSNRNIWLCTNHGLNLYDSITNSFIVYKHFPSKNIKVIAEDRDKGLWIGTDKGMCQIKTDGTILQAYDETNGLAGNIIHGMVCDDNGNIWVSTNNGISKFNPKTKAFQNFTQKDGLQDNAFFQGAFLKTRNGEIYFGGFKGFNSFFPNSIKVNTTVLPVYITEFQIFNKPVACGIHGSPLQKHISETKEIKLTHLQSVFSFGFTAINYTNPEKNVYAYKMEGFEKEWNYTDATRRYVTYTNLDPGKYIFRVKASNDDGIWNEEGTSIKIIILPPWWKTLWFKILTLTILVASIYITYYLKVAAYRKKQNELSILVKQRTLEISQANDILLDKQKLIEAQTEIMKKTNDELTKLNATKDKLFSIIAHDLKNPFHSLIGFSELLKLNLDNLPLDKTKKYINLIYNVSSSGYELLSNLLQWSHAQTGRIIFEPSPISPAKIAKEVLTLMDGAAQSKNITCQQLIADDFILCADENMLKAIFRNLISNAIKFSYPNSEVIISLKAIDNIAEISIKDFGVGIPDENLKHLFDVDSNISTKGTSNESGTGLGLLLCREFIEKHGGKIWVESEADKGSEFKFTLPLA